MATNFPGSLDSFTNPVAGDSLASPSHAGQHADVNDAIEAIETKLGIGAGTIGTWQDFPATKGFDNITEGDGNLIQRYCEVNEIVFFYATFELGSTSALTAGVFVLPVAMNDASSALHFTANFSNGSTGYAAMVRQISATGVIIRAIATSGTYATQAIVTSTVPFTWASGDRIAISGFYEKA